jgi:cell wall-associated protease
MQKFFLRAVATAAAALALAAATPAHAGGPVTKVPIVKSPATKAPVTKSPVTNSTQTEAVRSRLNQLLVKFKPGVSATQMQSIASGFSATRLERFYQPLRLQQAAERMQSWRVLSFAPGTNLSRAYENLLRHGQVESVAPNALLRVQATPNDLDTRLWGLHNTGQTGGRNDADIDAPEAWNTITQAPDVVVAVIDTGVDYTHPDLAANIWTNPGEIAGNGVDDDGNGYIDDVHGYDFANRDGDPMDDNSHGTHVAGTIGAVGNNSRGVVGVAWRTKIMALKFIGADGYGLTSDAINAILYAADMGAKVSNNSWGSFAYDRGGVLFAKPLQDAIQTAADAGMLFVAAAGNDGAFTDEFGTAVPAGLPVPNIISVAASDHTDELTWFSNHGAAEVHIAAPGANILSTVLNNAYDSYQGTSMAAPHIAGAAALLFAQTPGITPYEVKAILMNRADVVTGTATKVASGGRLNLNKAVRFKSGADCQAFSATPAAHITAGRAYACGTGNLYACAVGSSQQIGLRSSFTPVSLVRARDNAYATGVCKAGDMPPRIVLTGDTEKYLLAGTAYTAPAATAHDREDGTLTHKIRVTGNVNTGTPGHYILQYDVSDSAGNMAVPKKRIVHVVAEDRPPLVELIGPHCRMPLICMPIYLAQHAPYVEHGYVAYDELDGDLTAGVTRSGSVLTNTSQIGRYQVLYDVVDSRGQHNVARDNIYRDVFVLHPQLPSVFVEKPVVRIARGHCCFGPDAFAVDLKDGYVNVDVQGSVNRDVVGTYVLTFRAVDSDGNVATGTQTVHVVQDVTPPVITLNGPSTITVQRGQAFNDPWVNVTDDLDRWPRAESSGTVDTNVLGTYTVQYWGVDETGNRSNNISRTVRVVESCSQTSATVAQHITASRAVACGTGNLSGCAVGSNDNLGSRFATTPVIVHEQPAGAGFFYRGACTAQ